jgi:rod shape-determining protein MreD
MTTILLILLALTAVMVDLAFAPGATLLGVRPQFTLVVIALWAALRPDPEVLLLAPVTGFLLGLLGNEPLGASVLALAPAVVLGLAIVSRSTHRRFAFTMALVAVATPAYVLIVLLVQFMAGARPALGVEWLSALSRLCLANALLAAALYWPLSILPADAAAQDQFPRF